MCRENLGFRAAADFDFTPIGERSRLSVRREAEVGRRVRRAAPLVPICYWIVKDARSDDGRGRGAAPVKGDASAGASVLEGSEQAKIGVCGRGDQREGIGGGIGVSV